MEGIFYLIYPLSSQRKGVFPSSFILTNKSVSNIFLLDSKRYALRIYRGVLLYSLASHTSTDPYRSPSIREQE